MRKYNNEEFFMYCLLGITCDDSEELIINSCIKRAYRDAASRVVSFENDKEKEDLKEECIKLIAEEIRNIDKDFDKWHRDLLKKLYDEKYSVCKYKKDKKITYGVLQKWVNMTVKYVYMVYETFKSQDKNGEFRKSVKKLIEMSEKYHVPIDSYIMDALKKSLDIDYKKYIPLDRWSKICNYGEYMKLQNEIREKINDRSPIEWEIDMWIEQAKERR